MFFRYKLKKRFKSTYKNAHFEQTNLSKEGDCVYRGLCWWTKLGS